MSHKFFSSYFVVTLTAVTFAAALVWLDHFRTYEAETSVLVIDKAGTEEKKARTLAELAKNLSFYEAVLHQNDLLDDNFIGETLDDRKALWQKLVRVKEEDKSGVLSIRVRTDSQEQARLFSTETAKTLFETAARYYDIKSGFDMRIVDGPIVGSVVKTPWLFALVSLLTGFVVTTLFFGILRSIDRALLGKQMKKGFDEPHIGPETFRPSVPTGWKIEGTPEENMPRDYEEEVIEEPRPRESRAAAPANLPIMDEESITPLQGAMARLIKEDIDTATRAAAVEPVFGEERREPNTAEPSQDEYKRRLNALLSGKPE